MEALQSIKELKPDIQSSSMICYSIFIENAIM